jgi:flavodoxin I
MMKRIGLFYGKGTVKSTLIAKKIQDAFGDVRIELIAIEEAWQKDFEAYDCLIAGTSTWFDGELPTYWDEILPVLKTLDLKDKKIAVFGLGDQVNYPDNFVDGIGLLAKTFETAGAKLVGSTSTEGYLFNKSLAMNGEYFAGLAIDQENQADKTDERIRNWVEELKREFL